MKRVMVIGQPGAGKSTSARQLGAALGVPVVHIDQIYWQAGWTERDPAERLAMAGAAAKGEAWVIEGGMSATWDHRIDRADTVIFLDPPFLLRCWRVFWRTLRHHGTVRPDLPEGCPERFDPEFWRYIWRTRRTNRQRYFEALDRARAAQKDVYVLRSRRAWDRFLAAQPADP